jgi:hypothetical protein
MPFIDNIKLYIMKHHNIKFYILLSLAFIILLVVIYGIFNNINAEGYVNTKTCLSLTTDQIISANKVCNNLNGTDPSFCVGVIDAMACPIDGVATNALLLNLQKNPSPPPT